MDEIAEELEHQAFMAECRTLVQNIQWALMSQYDDRKLKKLWDDIEVIGDEPAFASVLFDRAIAEADL